MLSVWWDCTGIIYFVVLEQGQTVDGPYYCQQLDQLHHRMITDRPALVNRKGVILHHDNARPHTAGITQLKIASLGWEVLPHPPYSPDIAPSDYHLFRTLEHFLRGKSIADRDAIRAALSGFFASKGPSFYEKGIKDLVRRWETIINNDGDYIID